MKESDEDDEGTKPTLNDEMPQDSLIFALNSLKDKNYSGVVEAITGISEEDNDFYEKTHDLVSGIFQKNEINDKKASVVINNIYYLFVHHSDNISALDSNYISYASQFSPGTYPPEHESEISSMMHEKVTKESLARLTDMQLMNKIREIREKHKNLLARGEKISNELVENLNLLLEERTSRQGGVISKKQISDKNKDSQEVLGVSTDIEKGKYCFWFIQPTTEEVSKIINIHVVCGSPMIEVLRKRYKKFYSLTEIQEIKQQDLLRGSPEVQYELKKELKKQEDFVLGYMDPKTVADQDICAYSIYSTFDTDQFPEVPRFRERSNTLGTYFLKHGRLINHFDPDRKIHSLKVDGNIIGRFSISFNRREVVSGRIISDSYEVVEYQNGKPVLYFCSTKGRSALDSETLKTIDTSIRGVKMNLGVPVASEISDEKMLDKYKLQSSQQNAEDYSSAEKNNLDEGDKNNINSEQNNKSQADAMSENKSQSDNVVEVVPAEEVVASVAEAVESSPEVTVPLPESEKPKQKKKVEVVTEPAAVSNNVVEVVPAEEVVASVAEAVESSPEVTVPVPESEKPKQKKKVEVVTEPTAVSNNVVEVVPAEEVVASVAEAVESSPEVTVPLPESEKPKPKKKVEVVTEPTAVSDNVVEVVPAEEIVASVAEAVESSPEVKVPVLEAEEPKPKKKKVDSGVGDGVASNISSEEQENNNSSKSLIQNVKPSLVDTSAVSEKIKQNSDSVDLSSSQLRVQLIEGVRKKFSATTLKYLLDQIADKEGKNLDDIKQEMIATLPELSKILEENKLNVSIIKERAKQLKESMGASEGTEDSNKS